MSLPALSATYGALLLGSLIASALSGAVVIQTILYFKLYPSDPRRLKVLVVLIWALDTCHTSFIWSALWDYLVKFHGQVDKIDYVPRTLALSIIVTAALTFCVHCFFALRLFRLSSGNWILTTPVVILALLRLGTAAASTIQLLVLHSFSEFVHRNGWIFTLGLSSSSAVDVLITASLFSLLRKSGRGTSGNTGIIIDTLIIYTFETASLTSAATIVCMICWVVMPYNLIFMGLHFFIGKLYALSLLITLNIKSEMRDKFRSREAFPTITQDSSRRSRRGTQAFVVSTPKSGIVSPKLTMTEFEINIERRVYYSRD